MSYFSAILILLFVAINLAPINCLAEEPTVSTFGATSGTKIIVAPPPQKEKIDPCAQGQCDFGKKRKKRRGFGSTRKKATSSFGKGKNTKRSKAIDGGGKGGKSRGRKHFRRHR